MGRDWSKQRRSDQAKRVRSDEMDQARYLAEVGAIAAAPGKAELRAEAEAAVKAYRKPIFRLATVMNLHCPACKHRGSVRVPAGRTMPRFRCKRCGTTI